MNLIWTVGIVLISVASVPLFRRFFPEISVLFPLAAGVLLLVSLLTPLGEILSAVRNLGDRSGVSSDSLGLILRGVGICLITRFASGVCFDCGLRSLGETVDYCGQIAVVSLAVPSVLELAQMLLETDV